MLQSDIHEPMAAESVVFQVRNKLAVRLIGNCALPRGTRVRQRSEGDRIILEPVLNVWPQSFLAAARAWKAGVPRPRIDEAARDPFAF